MMHPASMRPLVSCARRSMPAQHCLCCCWGGAELARSGGMVTVLDTTHSARIPQHHEATSRLYSAHNTPVVGKTHEPPPSLCACIAPALALTLALAHAYASCSRSKARCT